MEKRKKHSDNNFMKGFGAWLLFDRITKIETLADFLAYKGFDEEGRQDAFKILRVLSFSVIIESKLIDNLYKEFETFGQATQDLIEEEIIEQIIRNHSLKGSDKEQKGKEILEEQLSDSRKIIIPPVLQYTAGYSMGGLIKFANKHFTLKDEIFRKLIEFKDHRNYIFHNSISSRDNLDDIVEKALKLGKELINSL